jgi:hypothetical protein
MAIEELQEPMTPLQDIPPDGLATAQQIADGFLGLVRHMDSRQLAGAKQPDELDRVATIGLDPLAWTPWRQCRGNDLTRDAARGDLPVEVVARDPSFVTGRDGSLAHQSPKQPLDQMGLLGHLALFRFSLPGTQDGHHQLSLAVIKPHVGRSILRHDPVSFRMWLCSLPGTTHANVR